eukprot:2020812-Rhodomonas_salina.3
MQLEWRKQDAEKALRLHSKRLHDGGIELCMTAPACRKSAGVASSSTVQHLSKSDRREPGPVH